MTLVPVQMQLMKRLPRNKKFGTQTQLSLPSEVSVVKLASGLLVHVCGQIELNFRIAKRSFSKNFLVLPKTSSIILRNPVFKKNSIELYSLETFMKLPDLTLQLNEVQLQRNRKACDSTNFSQNNEENNECPKPKNIPEL